MAFYLNTASSVSDENASLIGVFTLSSTPLKTFLLFYSDHTCYNLLSIYFHTSLSPFSLNLTLILLHLKLILFHFALHLTLPLSHFVPKDFGIHAIVKLITEQGLTLEVTIR